MKDTCSNCRFWQSNEDGSGECRKNPPILIVLGNLGEEYTGEDVTYFGRWPATTDLEWCGSHELAIEEETDGTG